MFAKQQPALYSCRKSELLFIELLCNPVDGQIKQSKSKRTQEIESNNGCGLHAAHSTLTLPFAHQDGRPFDSCLKYVQLCLHGPETYNTDYFIDSVTLVIICQGFQWSRF